MSWLMQGRWLKQLRRNSRKAITKTAAKTPNCSWLRLEPLEERRLLAVVTVDTLSDTVDITDGVTSLREAILAANLLAGPDTIDFAPALTASGPAAIRLSDGELPIADDLTIDGPGADLLTIDASASDPTPDENNGDGTRVFHIDDGQTSNQIDVSISNLTLTGGDVPGNPALTSGGGAILSRERLTVSHSKITGNAAVSTGGGIFNWYGELTVSASTIIGNSSSIGGGIANYGHFTGGGVASITNSLIGGNTARVIGGGISTYHGSLTLEECIIKGNSSDHGGGGISVNGNTLITSCTVSDNSADYDGGGVSSDGNFAMLTVEHSTFTNNSAGYNGGAFRVASVVAITNCAIDGNFAGQAGGGVSSAGFGFSQATISHCMIINNSTDGNGGGVHNIGIRANMTIADTFIVGNVAAMDGGGVFNTGGNLTIASTFIQENTADNDGGGISSQTDIGNRLTVSESVIDENSAGRNGGGIDTSTPTTVMSSAIVRNQTNGNGGGLHNRGRFVTVVYSEFSGNAANFGAGVHNNGDLDVMATTIRDNSAASSGGGLFNGGTLTVTGSTVSGNSAAHQGGGFLGQTGELEITNGTVSGNSATVGGGLYLFHTASIIRHTTVTENVATQSGGGAFVAGGAAHFQHTIVANNSAPLGRDLTGMVGAIWDARFSLIGHNAQSGLAESPVGAPDAKGNLIGGPNHGAIRPLLMPLAYNGGPTQTHALRAGSAAIDAGDPAAVAGVGGVPVFDQRGATFGRIFGDAIDIGAFEVQMQLLVGDYNLDGIVDAADWTIWSDTYGSTTDLRADGSGNRVVTQLDNALWNANFGESTAELRVMPDNQGDSASAISAFAAAVTIDPEFDRFAATSGSTVTESAVSSPSTQTSSKASGRVNVDASGALSYHNPLIRLSARKSELRHHFGGTDSTIAEFLNELARPADSVALDAAFDLWASRDRWSL